MLIPSAIIFINNDMTDAEKINIGNQLKIDETMSFDEFNSRMDVDPNYSAIVHLQNLRILVVLDSFQDLNNRNLADVVLFVKQGLASVEKNNFGKPGLTLDIQRINIYEILRYNNSPNVVIVPDFGERRHHHNSGAFGQVNTHINHHLYKNIPENQPGKPPNDPEEGE